MAHGINPFVLEHVFNKIEYVSEGVDGVVYWRDVVGDGEGYILYWPADGQNHHTYHYPPNLFEENGSTE